MFRSEGPSFKRTQERGKNFRSTRVKL